MGSLEAFADFGAMFDAFFNFFDFFGGGGEAGGDGGFTFLS
ncbi:MULTISPECIES: hypothetical protein [Hoyosella]|nr:MULTISPECIES: hypothetical protein [Hoyosella]MBB3037529.1 hypothetical protein [Hoyosella altamirensis]